MKCNNYRNGNILILKSVNMNFLSNSRTFIIAEIANSHEGDIHQLKKLVDECAKIKVNAIKFQVFKTEELLESTHEQFELFKKLEFSNNEWAKIIHYSKRKNLKIFSDVFGIKSAKLATKLNVDGFKIHSSDINNPVLLEYLSKINKPILLSTAGSYLYEIDEALKIIQKNSNNIALMHGFQGYPTKLSDLNLLRITELQKRYNLPIGLMDHISGNSELALIIPLIGIGLQVRIIEKHITLNRSKKGIDYYSSLNPNEFKKLVDYIRKSENALGTLNGLPKNELKYRLAHKKNTIARKFIKNRTALNEKLFEFKRTKTKVESLAFFEINGKKTKRNIKKSEVLTSNALSQGINKIAAIIACRVESDRLFGKPLQNVSGIPILKLLINQILKSKMINDIVLAISEKEGNEIFLEFARQNKIKFVIGDDTDVLHRLIKGAKYVHANIIFRVTSENPFIYWEGIDPAIKSHIDGKYDFSFIEKIPIGSGFEIINLKALEKSHKNGKRKHRSELCSLYIFENKNRFKINKLQPPKDLQYPNFRLTVDTLEDLQVSRIIYKTLGKNGKPIHLEKIIKFLKKNPQINQINSSIPLGVARIWE